MPAHLGKTQLRPSTRKPSATRNLERELVIEEPPKFPAHLRLRPRRSPVPTRLSTDWVRQDRFRLLSNLLRSTTPQFLAARTIQRFAQHQPVGRDSEAAQRHRSLRVLEWSSSRSVIVGPRRDRQTAGFGQNNAQQPRTANLLWFIIEGTSFPLYSQNQQDWVASSG